MSKPSPARINRGKLRNHIVAAAIKFYRVPEMQDEREELRGTNSTSAPAEFMNLMDACEDYLRPAQAKIRKFIESRKA